MNTGLQSGSTPQSWLASAQERHASEAREYARRKARLEVMGEQTYEFGKVPVTDLVLYLGDAAAQRLHERREIELEAARAGIGVFAADGRFALCTHHELSAVRAQCVANAMARYGTHVHQAHIGAQDEHRQSHEALHEHAESHARAMRPTTGEKTLAFLKKIGFSPESYHSKVIAHWVEHWSGAYWGIHVKQFDQEHHEKHPILKEFKRKHEDHEKVAERVHAAHANRDLADALRHELMMGDGMPRQGALEKNPALAGAYEKVLQSANADPAWPHGDVESTSQALAAVEDARLKLYRAKNDAECISHLQPEAALQVGHGEVSLGDVAESGAIDNDLATLRVRVELAAAKSRGRGKDLQTGLFG